MSTTSSSNTGATLGKILAGMFLYDFREVRDGGKTGPQMIQFALGKLKKYLGQESAKAFFDSSESSYCALMYACLDQIVLDTVTPETKERMSKLDPAERILVENLYLKATGQDITDMVSNGRWAPPLWKIRKMCKKYLDLSPTEVKPEELLQTLKDICLPLLQTIREHMSKTL